ncbi:MAG: DUF6468 domain-containing protein [Rickettsiales bacterium]
MFGIALDITVLVLLVTTIAFCWRLNNKIIELRHSRKDLSQLVKTFDVAIIKTHKNISDLKTMSASSAQELQAYLSKANELISDLSFMTETAAKLADRLENDITDLRQAPINTNLSNQQLEKMIANIGNSNEEAVVDNRNELLAAIKQARRS